MSDRFDITVERKLDTKPDQQAEVSVVGVRGSSLITGVMAEACSARVRRRRWSTVEKARMVLASLEPGVNVSEVARRHGLSPQQLVAWRRRLSDLAAESASASGAAAATVPTGPDTIVRRKRGRPRKDGRDLAPGADRAPAQFAPVVIAAPAASSLPRPAQPTPAAGSVPGAIEIAIGDAVVRVSGQVEANLIATVLRTLRRTP
jgi:transposase-like protein